MAITTRLSLTDQLPLTCSRSGSCCFGKQVYINPWELACLATAKELTPVEFRDRYCELGGIRLRFDGEASFKGMPACSQYISGFGCSVHSNRPLVCRLYPLGRQKQNDTQHYMFQGNEFPCLKDCPEVLDLPELSVSDYITGQAAGEFELVQDEYLEVMQNLADAAFVLLLESGLAQSGDRKTLNLWQEMGRETPELLAARIGKDWMDRLMLPELTDFTDEPESFPKRHYELLITEAEKFISSLETLSDYSRASVLMMALALHLGRSLGAAPSELSAHWIATAKENGACI